VWIGKSEKSRVLKLERKNVEGKADDWQIGFDSPDLAKGRCENEAARVGWTGGVGSE